MIRIRPVYDCRRHSRAQLWGVYVDGKLLVISRDYPSWAVG